MMGSMVLAMPRATSDREIRDRIIAWLQYHRHVRGWNQAALARAMKTTEATVSRIFSGDRSAGLDTLLLMRTNLHMDLNVVFDGPPPALKEPPLRRVAPPPGIEPEPVSSRAPASRSGSGR